MQTVAKVLLKKADDKLLLLRRSKTHPYYAYHLDLPGGEVEDGEDVATAIVREVREETGITIDERNLTMLLEEQADNHHYILYSGIVDGDVAITLSWEHDQFSWLTLQELLDWQPPTEPDNYYKMLIRALTTAPKNQS